MPRVFTKPFNVGDGKSGLACDYVHTENDFYIESIFVNSVRIEIGDSKTAGLYIANTDLTELRPYGITEPGDRIYWNSNENFPLEENDIFLVILEQIRDSAITKALPKQSPASVMTAQDELTITLEPHNPEKQVTLQGEVQLDPSLPQLGKILDNRFRLEAVLGKGGFAIVYKAYDQEMDSHCAVKLALNNSEEFVERFKRERKVAFKFLTEVGLVGCYHSGLANTRWRYIVLDLVPNARDLDLKNGSLFKKLTLFTKAVKLVSRIHELGLVHRDIKPSNFLVDEQGNVFLSDFGISKADWVDEFSSTNTKSNVGMGTPGFMSYEQFTDVKRVSQKTDIFALGVMLYLSLTGNLPYGTTFRALNDVILKKEKQANPKSVNPSLDDLLCKLCCKTLELEEEKRTITAKELAHELDDYFSNLQMNTTTQEVSVVEDALKAGQEHSDKGQLQEALSSFKVAVNLDPNNAQALTSLGQVQARLGMNGEAILNYNHAISLEPLALLPMLKRAEAYSSLGKFNHAITDLDQALILYPECGQAYNNRGTAKEKLKQFDKALLDYNKAIETSPKEALPAYINRAQLRIKRDCHIEALEDLTIAISIDPSLPILYCKRSSVKLKLEQWDSALEDINKAMSLEPNIAMTYQCRASAYEKRGELSKAIQDLSKAIDLEPNEPGYYYNRGRINHQLNEIKASVSDYSQAIALDEKFRLAYINRGNLFILLGQFDEALKDFDHAESLTKDAQIYYNRGTLKNRLQRYESAISDFDKAINFDSNHFDAFNNRGNSQRELGNYEQAMLDYDVALKLNPAHYLALCNRGEIKTKLKKVDEALLDFHKAIQIDRDCTRAYNLRALANFELGSHEQALHDLNRCIELAPRQSGYYRNRGSINQALNRFNDAITDFTKYIELEPEDHQGYFQRGIAKFNAEEYEEAIIDYSKVIELAPKFWPGYQNRGATFDVLGLNSKAKEDFNMVTSLKH